MEPRKGLRIAEVIISILLCVASIASIGYGMFQELLFLFYYVLLLLYLLDMVCFR